VDLKSRRKSQFRELTPEPLRCVIAACPAVFEDANAAEILVIGRRLNDTELSHRVGEGEALVAISREMLVEALARLNDK
jgi:hypothetical protein